VRSRCGRGGAGVEGPEDVVRRLRAVGGVLLEQAHDERRETGRHGGSTPVQRLRGLRHVRSEQLLGGPPLERWPAREHLVGDDAERV